MLRMRTKVGVMGSAGGDQPEDVKTRCRDLGRQIARHGCILITGACPGLPHEAALGSQEEGGLNIGVSPGHCLDEHINMYRSPWEPYEALIFTGSGLMGREIEAIRSCDIVVLCGGRSGTLGEFAIAYDEGKLIGALLRTGGISDHIEEIVSRIDKETGAELYYNENPHALIDACIEAHERRVREGVAYCIPHPDG
jgi:uncharacterized protein (TIGR00725 family)